MSSIPALDTTVCNVPDCDDVDSAVNCLKALGCEVQRFGNSCAVKPFPKNVPVRTVSFDFGQSTTASRIAIALAAAFGISADCQATGENPHIKNVSLTSRMALRGVRFTGFSLPFSMQGRLEAGDSVLITGSEKSIRLLRIHPFYFFSLLRSKLIEWAPNIDGIRRFR